MSRVYVEELERSAGKVPFDSGESKTSAPHGRNKRRGERGMGHHEARIIDEKIQHPDVTLLRMLAQIAVMTDLRREARQLSMWEVCMAFITLAMQEKSIKIQGAAA
ncbi:MAG TPA: hypothetical protein VEJ39_02500 [Candidatus Acidoferrales bacterium]|nr:hypothetical protein [Candidatus Acidoferrales bacterium]